MNPRRGSKRAERGDYLNRMWRPLRGLGVCLSAEDPRAYARGKESAAPCRGLRKTSRPLTPCKEKVSPCGGDSNHKPCQTCSIPAGGATISRTTFASSVTPQSGENDKRRSAVVTLCTPTKCRIAIGSCLRFPVNGRVRPSRVSPRAVFTSACLRLSSAIHRSHDDAPACNLLPLWTPMAPCSVGNDARISIHPLIGNFGPAAAEIQKATAEEMCRGQIGINWGRTSSGSE